MVINKKIQSLVIISFSSIIFIIAAWYMYQNELQKEMNVSPVKPGTMEPISGE